MATIPLAVIFGILVFACLKWWKQKALGVVIGILFGMSLMTTGVGMPIYNGTTDAAQTIATSIADSVLRR